MKTKVQVDKFFNARGEPVYRFYPGGVWDEVDHIGENAAIASYPRYLWEWVYAR